MLLHLDAYRLTLLEALPFCILPVLQACESTQTHCTYRAVTRVTGAVLLMCVRRNGLAVTEAASVMTGASAGKTGRETAASESINALLYVTLFLATFQGLYAVVAVSG